MRKFFQTKKMMSFVCVLFTAILSLSSINIINYQDLLTTSSQEEVYDENINTSNENDNNTINNEENNSQNDKNETNNNGTTENTDNTTGTGEEDDLDDVVGARDTWNNHASTSLSGSGTSRNPYKIENAADLAYLTRSSANKSAYYELTNNIDLSGYDWMPIHSFQGNFNGNGYTISNMTINTKNSRTGLFHVLYNNGRIENFILTGSINISLSGTVSSYDKYFIGGVVSFVEGTPDPYATTISSVASFVDISFSCNALGSSIDGLPYFYIGGIAGATTHGLKAGEVLIDECVFEGHIYINQYMASRVNSNRTYCGGILGRAMTETHIEYCINYGSIRTSNQYSAYYTGGILGYAEVPSTKDEDNVSVYSCINYGSITVNNKSDDFRVGGIVGQMGEKSFWLNEPTGSIEYCINYGNVTTSLYCKYSGQIAGYLDSEFYAVACKYPARMFGERNESTGMWISMAYSDLDDVKDFMNYYRDSAYADDNCDYILTGVDFTSNNSITNDYITVGDFIRSVNIIVAVRNEDGTFTRIPNKKLGYDIGYNTDMKIYKKKLSTDAEYLYNYQYMFKSTSEYEIISSIYNNSKDKYEYIGLSTSLNEEDIFTDETSYSSNTYDLPYNINIYVLFDIAGEDEPEPVPEPEPEPELPTYFRVYYTEQIGFNGNLPSDLHLDSTGMSGSVVTEIGGVRQTSNSGYIGYSKVKYQAEISLIAYPEDEYELCGVYAGDVGENPNECVNLAEFMNNATYLMSVNFSLDMSFDYVEYSFYNEIYDDDGNLVTNYSIVFSKYQYSGISFTQTFETNRFDEPYEYEMTTDFVYGYLNRSLGGFRLFSNLNLSRGNTEPRFYPVDEDGNISDIYETNYQLDFRDQDLNFNFFDGDGSHYVGELLTPTYGITNPTSASKLGFYWLWGANDTQEENKFYFRRYTGDTQFSNNRTIIEGRGLTAVPANKANNYPPYFTINLYNYFIIGNAFDDYGNINPSSAYLSGPGFNYIDFRVNDGNSAFKEGSVSFKEYSDPSQQQNFNLYFLNTYEDMGSNDLLFGDNGGKFEVSSLGGYDVQKTSFKVEDGVVYPVDAENGEEVEGYSVLNIGLRFTYQFVFRNSDPFESYYDTEGDDVILNEEDKQLIMETPITELFRFTKSPNYLYYDDFRDRNTLIWDLPTYSSIDLSDFTIYDLALKMLEDDEENATYQNMENGNILLYNYFEVNRFRIVVMLDDEYSFDIDSVLSFYVNDMKYPQSSAEQYAIGNIKAYSEIELEIEDSVIYDSRLGRYTVYAYNNITSGGVQMTNQDSWHFQVIPEINSQNLVFTVNLDEVFSMTSSDFSSSSIQRVGNMWYIDEARDFYYLYYLNAFAGEDFEGIRLIQTANIDFGGASIMPLGTSSTPFRGVYDGQYYTIQNFEINFGSASNVGFFGYVDGAEIKNLTLLDGTVEGFDNVGGVVGYANNSTLTRLGNYSVNVSGGGSYSINNNIFVITTTGQFTPLSYANLDTYVNKGLSEELLMRNNSGSIDFTTYPTSSQTSMGGFAGFVSLSTLNTCFSRGNVNGSATERGGFVGRANYSSITYCYTTYSTPSGMLSGTTTSHYHTTNGRDIDDVCSTCADRFIW